MIKRLQNHIAESRYALPVTAVYAVVIWLLGGLLVHQWWLQFACFALSAYFIVLLNNVNALIRIYSRMVSCAYLVLSCMACFLFDSFKGGAAQLCYIVSNVLLFRCYRDEKATGWMFYMLGTGFHALGTDALFRAIHLGAEGNRVERAEPQDIGRLIVGIVDTLLA